MTGVGVRARASSVSAAATRPRVSWLVAAPTRAQKPTQSSGTTGFRCCAGPPNTVEVVLDIKHGPELKLNDRIDKPKLAMSLDALPPEASGQLGDRSAISVDHQWLWRPIGNEELIATRLCSGLGQRPACGVLINRMVLGRPSVLAWASSRHWLPSLETDRDARDLWMIGGDETGTYQRLIQYRFGIVSVTAEEHRVHESAGSQKRRRRARRRHRARERLLLHLGTEDLCSTRHSTFEFG